MNLTPEQQIIKLDDLIEIAARAAESESGCSPSYDKKSYIARAFVSSVSGKIHALYGEERADAFCRAIQFDHLIGIPSAVRS